MNYKITGLNSVLAVVRDSNSYNVTLDSKENTMKLLNGVEIDGKDYDIHKYVQINTISSPRCKQHPTGAVLDSRFFNTPPLYQLSYHGIILN
jgi:hypothetical protein